MTALIKKLTSRRKVAAKASQDARRALQELRDLGARLRSQRADIEARPVPLEEAQDGAARAVLAEAEGMVAEINLASLIRPGDGRAPYLNLTGEQRGALAFIAGVETIAAAISQRLAHHYEKLGLSGIPEDERTAELARLEGEILAAELAEEAVIREMEAEGAAPLRRADAAPEALLAHDTELR